MLAAWDKSFTLELEREFSHRLIASQERERKRLASELHDGLAQRLTIIKNLLAMKGYEAIVENEVSEALREVREISHSLRPYQLDHLGLKRALEALVDTVAKASYTKFQADLEDVDALLPKDVQVSIYRIAQECLQNIVKHARARNAKVLLRHRRGKVSLEVSDDGIGFANGRPTGIADRGMGLESMSERAIAFRGTFAIRTAEGIGTCVRVELKACLRRDPNCGTLDTKPIAGLAAL